MSPPREERVMTVEDWKALYIAHRLCEQIVLHGASALRTFVSASKHLTDA